jgi:hypothetical protein
MVGYGLGYRELSDATNLVDDISGDQILNMLAWTVKIGDSTASARRIATIMQCNYRRGSVLSFESSLLTCR